MTSANQQNSFGNFYEEKTSNTPWKLGAHVNHAKFGFGVILNFEGHGKTGRVQVKFQDHGSKWLLTDYANLEIV